MDTTKIIQGISITQFDEMLSICKPRIFVSPHALDHLSDSQRRIFNEQGLINILLKEKPAGIGLQRNGRYAAFYKRKHGYLRIIFGVKNSNLEIITFINTKNMPNLKRIKNDE